MATVGRFPLSHSCANADSLGNPASTGQDTPRSPRHPAESARPLHHHPDAGRRPVARTKRRHQHQIRRAGNRDGGRLGHGNVQRTPDKELKRRTQPGPCSRESRGSREGGEVSEETQDGPGRILSTIQCLGSAGPDRFSRNNAVETQESPAKQAKAAKERRETVLWEASRNGGQNLNPGDPFPFAPFGFFAGQLPFPSAWFRFSLRLLRLRRATISFSNCIVPA